MVTCANTLTVFKIHLKGPPHILITRSPTNDLWKTGNSHLILCSGGLLVMRSLLGCREF